MMPDKLDKFESHQSDEEEANKSEMKERYLDICMSQIKSKSKFLEAPRQIPKKSYSLAPDMATGWKPKRKPNINFQNAFPLNFRSDILDQIVKNLSRRNKNKFSLAFLGPRKLNSFILHQNRQYINPYPLQKKIQTFMTQRPGINVKALQLIKQPLQFNSDFQSGNLDIAIKINNESEKQQNIIQYDLFMRVDTNTKGHTNWFHFEVKPQSQWVGSVKFNICNFRRPKSLYQRGMKPYVCSINSEDPNNLFTNWKQGGKKVSYEKKALRYKFLYEDQDDCYILSTYYTLSFIYDFDKPNDIVRFAYCIPYTYSQLLTMIREVSCISYVKYETGWRSLSGLPIPILQITNFDEPQFNKKVVLVTARIHPGQSNSSHVCDGLIRALCFDSKSEEILKKIHFYIVPMLNPDGVVAGNYRTSLFGRDLNRTFHQSRKYAFPQTLHLVNFANKLKKQHKQRFNIYLDLHGHSVKKNIFFYGPDYNIAHEYYTQSRDFPKILGNLTSMFRYYSCIFRISTQKVTTARATFNRSVKIPFTYTLESSNGAFYDSAEHQQKNFTSKKWSEMGLHLVTGLNLWVDRLNRKNNNARLSRKNKYIAESSSDQSEQNDLTKVQPPGKQKQSDDEISQGKSDSQPEEEDLKDEQLLAIQNQIQGRVKTQQKQKKKTPLVKERLSPQKSLRTRNKAENMDWSQNLRGSYNSAQKMHSPIRRERLPPINLQVNPVKLVGNFSKKKKLAISEALNNLTSVEIKQQPLRDSLYKKKSNNSRLSISQMISDQKGKQIKIQQNHLILKKKLSRQEIDIIKKSSF